MTVFHAIVIARKFIHCCLNSLGGVRKAAHVEIFHGLMVRPSVGRCWHARKEAGSHPLKNSLIYRQLREAVGHRRHRLRVVARMLHDFWPAWAAQRAGYCDKQRGHAIRPRERNSKTEIKVQQEEGSTTRITNRPRQQEQTDGGSRRRSD